VDCLREWRSLVIKKAVTQLASPRRLGLVGVILDINWSNVCTISVMYWMWKKDLVLNMRGMSFHMLPLSVLIEP
jgi:hypothetical protein